jgi:rRNA maturation endonuclease Nob1/tetratricopeptide (TPR) repeat protein
MANVWVVDSNCFIHVGSMAPDGFLKDLKKILAADGSALYVTPGVHGEIKTVRFQRWRGQPNLLDEIKDLIITVAIDEAEVKALAQQIGEKASPQDVDLSLMILGSKLAHEGHKVTLVSDDYKMTTTGERVNLNFETCPPSTFLQRLADSGNSGQRTRMRSLSRRVRAAEMRYAISRAGQYDIQAKLTWMVDSLLSSRVAIAEETEEVTELDESKLIAGLIRTIRGERVKKSTMNKLGSLPEICAPVSKLDAHLSSMLTEGSSDDLKQAYDSSIELLSDVLEETGSGLAPLGEELAELAHRAMSGSLYRMESALGMLSKMSGNLKLSRLHLSRALSIATLVDDVGAEMRAMHQLGLLALAAKNWNRAATLFEAADRQSQTIGANRLGHLVLAGIARHIDGDEDLAMAHTKSANSIVSEDKNLASQILTNIGNSLLAIDCPGLAIEVLDEAMECATESKQTDRMEMLAEMLLLANTAMTNKEQVQYEGLRLLLDRLNSISDVATKEFESQISEIDQKAEQLSKPLDQTWNEWQPASKLIPENTSLTIVRIDEDDDGRVLLVSHHSEIGAIGLWLPEGGVEAAPGSSIEIHESRIKVAPPTDMLRDIHNIRGIIAVENPEAIAFIAKTDEIIDEEM